MAKESRKNDLPEVVSTILHRSKKLQVRFGADAYGADFAFVITEPKTHHVVAWALMSDDGGELMQVVASHSSSSGLKARLKELVMDKASYLGFLAINWENRKLIITPYAETFVEHLGMATGQKLLPTIIGMKGSKEKDILRVKRQRKRIIHDVVAKRLGLLFSHLDQYAKEREEEETAAEYLKRTWNDNFTKRVFSTLRTY